MKMFTRLAIAMIGAAVAFAGAARAQKPPLLPEKDVAALASELSGGDGETKFGGDCPVSPAARVARIS